MFVTIRGKKSDKFFPQITKDKSCISPETSRIDGTEFVAHPPRCGGGVRFVTLSRGPLKREANFEENSQIAGIVEKYKQRAGKTGGRRVCGSRFFPIVLKAPVFLADTGNGITRSSASFLPV
jgi:hypothetical protein